jgi:hypothetical protein
MTAGSRALRGGGRAVMAGAFMSESGGRRA